jgi:hypothetical protein
MISDGFWAEVSAETSVLTHETPLANASGVFDGVSVRGLRSAGIKTATPKGRR